MDDTGNKPLTPPAESLLPIRTVSILTGVKAITLRAWERRYSLIIPQRTPKGHRLYTQQDVGRINRIVELLNQGISVGHVKPLLDQEPDDVIASSATNEGDTWKDQQDRMLNAIESFDEQLLDNTYNDALSLYPLDIVNQRLTTPLMRLLGERWKKRKTGIAEEHFFSLYLRNKLGARIHHMNQRGNSPLLLLACLPGELHETGLLFFALAVVDAGYRALILGANTPLQQIPGVLAKKPCAAVVLSGSSKPARGLLGTELPDLITHVKAPVFVGGNISVSHQLKLEQGGAICLGDNIASGLQLINKTVKINPPH
jgi:DNA-binding transcriptional MerR regulator